MIDDVIYGRDIDFSGKDPHAETVAQYAGTHAGIISGNRRTPRRHTPRAEAENSTGNVAPRSEPGNQKQAAAPSGKLAAQQRLIAQMRANKASGDVPNTARGSSGYGSAAADGMRAPNTARDSRSSPDLRRSSSVSGSYSDLRRNSGETPRNNNFVEAGGGVGGGSDSADWHARTVKFPSERTPGTPRMQNRHPHIASPTKKRFTSGSRCSSESGLSTTR